MKTAHKILSILPVFLALLGSSSACFAQGTTQTQNNVPSSEDPSYLHNPQSSSGTYTLDRPTGRIPADDLTPPAPAERNPASGPGSVLDPSYQSPAHNPNTAPNLNNTTPPAPQAQPPAPVPAAPPAAPNQNANTGAGPVHLDQFQRDNSPPPPVPPVTQNIEAQRVPASAPETAPALEPETPRSESNTAGAPPRTQNSFFEITPFLGSISAFDKNAFTVGTFFSFNVLKNAPLYLEPGLAVSFLSGDNNQNTTLFHINAALRYDFVLNGSPVIPFVRAGLGPTLSSNSNTVVNNNTVSDSYLNQFYGGGLKIMLNPNLSARIDAGVTLQATDPGLYAAGAVALPL